MEKRVQCPQCESWCSWEDNPFRPFCSERCKTVDLGHWANEKYRIPDDTNPVNPDDVELSDENSDGKTVH